MKIELDHTDIDEFTVTLSESKGANPKTFIFEREGGSYHYRKDHGPNHREGTLGFGDLVAAKLFDILPDLINLCNESDDDLWRTLGDDELEFYAERGDIDL